MRRISDSSASAVERVDGLLGRAATGVQFGDPGALFLSNLGTQFLVDRLVKIFRRNAVIGQIEDHAQDGFAVAVVAAVPRRVVRTVRSVVSDKFHSVDSDAWI